MYFDENSVDADSCGARVLIVMLRRVTRLEVDTSMAQLRGNPRHRGRDPVIAFLFHRESLGGGIAENDGRAQLNRAGDVEYDFSVQKEG